MSRRGAVGVDARAAAVARVLWVLVALPRLWQLPVVDLAFAWPMRLALGGVAYGLALALAIGHRARGVSLLLVLVLWVLGGRSNALLDGSDRWLRATVLFLPFCELGAAWSREVARGERAAWRRVPSLPLGALALAAALASANLIARGVPAAVPTVATLGLVALLVLPARVFDRLRRLPPSAEEGAPRTSSALAAALAAQLALYAWGLAAAHGLVPIPGLLVAELAFVGLQP